LAKKNIEFLKPGFLPTGFLVWDFQNPVFCQPGFWYGIFETRFFTNRVSGRNKTDIPRTRTPKKPGFLKKPGFCWGVKVVFLKPGFLPTGFLVLG